MKIESREKTSKKRHGALAASFVVALAATSPSQPAEAQPSAENTVVLEPFSLQEVTRLCKNPSGNPFFETYFNIATGESVMINGQLQNLRTIGNLELLNIASALDSCTFIFPNDTAIREHAERALFELNARNAAYSASADEQGNINEQRYQRTYTAYYNQAGRSFARISSSSPTGR